ncbi:hypothetical protein QN277_002192 [Acacia crassicarpa]|uniref:Uncharacterized protein n=1 Tax=Acacia crassicarpa TaxID=499986 RepID=A0AAE1THT8_9FABA|nr:hypothetical protein QN277_002192 [Acacia crassicarpa]
MDTIAESVLQGLASLALKEFKLLRNAKHDVERMKNTVRAIRATLLDAEEKANNSNHQVSNWLARLKDVLYDADDLLDDLSAEALRRKIMTQNKVAKKVRIFFSESNQLAYNLKMAHKLRELWETLDEIENDRRQFNLTDQPLKPLSVLERRKQTGSNLKDEMIGREEEKHIILRYLLDNNVKSSVSVIPIVGFGGLGKTALAQLVYNHEDVKKHFGLKRWVCVSDDFNVKQIAQKILGQEGPKEMKQEQRDKASATRMKQEQQDLFWGQEDPTEMEQVQQEQQDLILGQEDPKEMEQVQQDLRQLIEGKNFLIVLDDVWNDDVECWHDLKRLLSEEVEGGMIIVTTRSEKVANMMGTHPPIILEGLDGDRSWQLFRRMAFVEGREPNNKELITIGREVVNKCGGVPLAIRTVGSLVYEKTLEGITDLSYLRNCELWNVDKKLEERVFAVLKLSYDHLPSPLKNCIAFCSLFPKDFSFKKQTLIQMWVAEGFIQPTDSMRCEEDVGNEYFMSLLSRSFFQDVIRDHCDNIVKCKMHDLIHDLALYVAKHEYLVIRDVKEKSVRDPTRHLSIDVPRDWNWEVPISFHGSEKLRTMLLHVTSVLRGELSVDLVASKSKYLRVLNLSFASIYKLPNNIEKLKHLRFLDLSRNRFMRVPKAVTRLHNLQTLYLCENHNLLELPRDISKLVSLKHLYITRCLSLEWMPRGLGQLTSLQTLTNFVVAEQEMHGIGARSARISELGKLNNLRGTLIISGLSRLRSNHKEAESARLKEKQHLQQLLLVWGTYQRYFVSHKVVAEDELILERLHPHHTIKVLCIKGFGGERLPEWIGELLELQHLVLVNCEHLTSLPEGLRNLTSLRTFTIENSPSLAGDKLQKVAHIPRMDLVSLDKAGLLELPRDHN